MCGLHGIRPYPRLRSGFALRAVQVQRGFGMRTFVYTGKLWPFPLRHCRLHSIILTLLVYYTHSSPYSPHVSRSGPCALYYLYALSLHTVL